MELPRRASAPPPVEGADEALTTTRTNLHRDDSDADGRVAGQHQRSGSDDGVAESQHEYREHAWGLKELQVRLGIALNDSDPRKSSGLSSSEARARVLVYGKNQLTPPPTKPDWQRLLEKFLDPFMLLLEAAALLSFILYATPPHVVANLYVGVVLAATITLTCLMAYYQEGQSAKLMSSFAGMMSSNALVIRDEGSSQRIPSSELTLGDVVVLESGERVPADLRILSSEGLKVDNSSFTGESLPVELHGGNLSEEEAGQDALHAHNMAFNSALVVEGRGVGVVVRVGDHTMIGRIAHLASGVDSSSGKSGKAKGDSNRSTLEVEVLRFVHVVTVLALATGVAFYVIAVARGGNPLAMFISCFVVIVIANVPEGLPATVTSCLTISARRLAARQVFVKRLDVIETLGSTSVIASDKTGTLTQNKMTVSHVFFSQHLRPAQSMARDPHWRQDATFTTLLTAGALCNMADFEEEESAADQPTTSVLVPVTPAVLASMDASSSNTTYSRSRRGLSNLIHGTVGAGGPLPQHHSHHRTGSSSLPSILQTDFYDPPGTTQHHHAAIVTTAGGGEGHSKAGSSLGSSSESVMEEGGPIPVRKLHHLIVGQASFSGLPSPVHASVQHSRSAPSGKAASNASQPSALSVRPGAALSNADASSLASYSTWGAHTRAASHLIQLPARKIVGNPSDVAVFNLCHGFADVEDLRRRHKQVYQIPFNSRNKWMMSVHLPSKTKDHLVAYLKGAPEIIASRCSHVMGRGGKVTPMDQDFRARFEEVYQEVASKGERVLALALQPLDPAVWPTNTSRDAFKEREESLPRAGYTFIGLVSLVDPPKPGVADAVLRCKEAGVKVIMITGDHPLTAEAIARQVNIIHEYNTRDEIAREEGCELMAVPDSRVGAQVIFCKDLCGYDDAAWSSLLAKPELVFARATPQDKLTIVERLRAHGAIVAVTGDGVNDSPALKKAHVGIAMGIMGSEVAKNAANVILMDDDFSSIVNGIEEGRVLFDNLTKTIAYTLTHALPELLAVVINIVGNAPVGLTSLMILSIDLLTEICPSISFAWEPPESSVMRRPPRVIATDRLVRPSLLLYSYLQAGLIEALACLSAYLLVFSCNHVPLGLLPHFAADPAVTVTDPASGRAFTYPEQAKIASMAATAYYVTLILSQALHIFAVKTRLVSLWEHGPLSNVTMTFGVMAALGIMCFIVFVPGIDMVFGAYPRLSALYFLLPALVAGALLLLWSEVRKAVLRSLIHRPTALFARIFAW